MPSPSRSPLTALLAAALAACGGGGSSTPSGHLVGGTATGLWGPGLVLASPGLPDLAVPADATTFTFGQRVPPGTAYDVTIKAAPEGLTCTLQGGAGTVGGGDVTSVAVVCGCSVAFGWGQPMSVTSVAVRGDWDGFAADAPLRADGGRWTGTLGLTPGLHAYEVVVGGVAGLDPEQGRRAWASGLERSAVKVPDCRLPSFAVEGFAAARPSAGGGTLDAALALQDGVGRAGFAAGAVSAALEHEGTRTPLAAPALAFDPASGAVSVHLAGLPDGKYRLVLDGATRGARAAEPLRLPFWIEATPFDWRGALLYSVLTDRFQDGDPSNTPGPTSGVDPAADWTGGDFEGIRQAIADGTLDALGVDAVVLSPPQAAAGGGWLDSDGVHLVAGYDGSFPVAAREVEPRLGGAAALRALVAEAHRHGIRVVAELVLDHVHQSHPDVAAHPDWFNDGCICGTVGCDWTARKLDCRTAPHLLDVAFSVNEATATFVADAAWWLDAFDLDGLRLPGLDRTEPALARNLAAEVREGFERGGTRLLLEAVNPAGWTDCGPGCPANLEAYAMQYRGVGPLGFGAASDDVLYFSSVLPVFALGDRGLVHADYWLRKGEEFMEPGAVRAPWLSRGVGPRFVTLADYADGNRDIPHHRWTDVATAPSDAVPYDRARLALTWLLSEPGAPDLLAGDEYGQWGGAPPNAVRWRVEASLSAPETAVLAHARKLGTLRRTLPALRTGAHVTLGQPTDDVAVFGRLLAPGEAAVVALNRSVAAQAVTVDASPLGFAGGTVLRDRLGGPDAVVGTGGALSLTVPAGSAVVLAP